MIAGIIMDGKDGIEVDVQVVFKAKYIMDAMHVPVFLPTPPTKEQNTDGKFKKGHRKEYIDRETSWKEAEDGSGTATYQCREMKMARRTARDTAIVKTLCRR